MMRTREARKRTRIIHTCLGNWYRCGSIFLTFKAFGVQIRFMQRWWRKVCAPKLALARTKLYQRWIRLERADVLKDVKARDLKELQEAKAKRADVLKDVKARDLKEL